MGHLQTPCCTPHTVCYPRTVSVKQVLTDINCLAQGNSPGPVSNPSPKWTRFKPSSHGAPSGIRYLGGPLAHPCTRHGCSFLPELTWQGLLFLCHFKPHTGQCVPEKQVFSTVQTGEKKNSSQIRAPVL